jgi:hypothetical protein
MHEKAPQPNPEQFPEILNTADLSGTILAKETLAADPEPIIRTPSQIVFPERLVEPRRKEGTRQLSLKRRGSGDPLVSVRRAYNKRQR